MISKRKETFKIIADFPFDSIRKRMSILVKDESGNRILFTKGAENVMLDRIDFDKSGIDGLRDIVEQDLYSFS